MTAVINCRLLGARMGRATTEKAERYREMPRDETPDRNPDGRVLPGHRNIPDLPFKAVARVQIPLAPGDLTLVKPRPKPIGISLDGGVPRLAQIASDSKWPSPLAGPDGRVRPAAEVLVLWHE